MGKREELHKMIEHLEDTTLTEAWDFIRLLLTKNSGYNIEEFRKISKSQEDIRLGNYILLDEILKKIKVEDD